MIDKYINEVCAMCTGCYIFGAGRVSQIVYDLMNENNVPIEAFLVTDASQNKDELFGKKVLQADNSCIDKTKPTLIAVIERGEKKIRPYLEQLGYTNIIDAPDGILEYDPWEHKRARTPVIEVTAKIGCAVNCKYCPQKLLVSRYYESDKSRKGVMTLEDYKGYLDKCPQETIVDFSGFVEPFLIDDSVDMMEYTYQTGHEMTLFTTLRGLSVDQAKRVLAMPFRFVCLHTPDKDGYANIPMTEEYFQVLEMFLKAKKENGEPFIDVANCQSEPHSEVVKRTQGRLKIYCEMSDRAGNLDENDTALAHVRTEGPIYCSRAYALNHNILLPDGSLALCCNDFGLDNIIGNLSEQSYDEIMHGDVIRNIKRAMHIEIDKDMICRKCMFACKVEKSE